MTADHTAMVGLGLTRCSPFSSLPAADADAAVDVRQRDLGIATILARKGQHAVLTSSVNCRFGIDLPTQPRRVAAEDIAFIGVGPGAWLAVSQSANGLFARTLAQSLAGLASVIDQSAGYAVLQLAGPGARDLLGKLLPVDLHPRAFAINAVAATVTAHIGVTLWRLEDRADGSPIFEIAVFRSFADSLWLALCIR